MLLAITQNPHLKEDDQKVLWKSLEEKKEKSYIEEEKLDKTAFFMLKNRMSSAANSKMIVK